uniref:Uncharacterized protein n=1 Tax=Ananas comosus var. bracteatus TaxID=296719 RepID=A0A6V7QDF9_ANACO|nr:unnamed protein product [Ananas comosus var. bracteatus]
MASQQMDARASRGREEREGSVTDHEDGPPEHIRRDLLRIRGRQARLELVMRMARERQGELQNLSEHRAVSDFAHRNRIQALLRGRFLRNGVTTEDERPPSAATRELGLLRQRHPVSGLREGFRFRLENIVRGQAVIQSNAIAVQNVTLPRNEQSQSNNASESPNDNPEPPQSGSENINFQQREEQETTAGSEYSTRNGTANTQEAETQNEIWHEEDTDHEETREESSMNWQENLDHEETGEESGMNWQENMEQEWAHEAPEDEDGEEDDAHLPQVLGEWHDGESRDTAENWQDDDHPNPPIGRRSTPLEEPIDSFLLMMTMFTVGNSGSY